MESWKRKRNRLPGFDYGSTNAYFITVCVESRQNLFWKCLKPAFVRPEEIPLSNYGQIAANAIANIPHRYPLISVDRYIIMPNHVHILLQIHQPRVDPFAAKRTISTIINQWKGYISKQIGFSPWQKSFYEHIIRNEADYLEKWKYIEENPFKLAEDDLCKEFCV